MCACVPRVDASFVGTAYQDQQEEERTDEPGEQAGPGELDLAMGQMVTEGPRVAEGPMTASALGLDA